MQHNITTRPAAIFVCHSDLDLQTACHHLQVQYHLPAFLFGEHSNWEYARSVGQQVGFNVTKTERLDTIAHWMKGLPKNVNYQIILFLDQTGMTEADATKGARAAIEEIYAFLKDVFATNVLWVGPQRGAA
jgi:hypothetical protein